MRVVPQGRTFRLWAVVSPVYVTLWAAAHPPQLLLRGRPFGPRLCVPNKLWGPPSVQFEEPLFALFTGPPALQALARWTPRESFNMRL